MTTRDIPRLGFLGLGWIGLSRLSALVRSGACQAVALADPAPAALEQALAVAPGARVVSSAQELLSSDLDGLVIATPSAQHAEQSLAALAQGVPVFCQKPLGRNADETRRVVQAARAADTLLGVDLSYRYTCGGRAVHRLVSGGELGQVYAVSLTFHNAYGPDKPWFYDRRLAGGGCLIDLGIHLVDLALWSLGFPRVETVTGRLFAQGHPLPRPPEVTEDYAAAQLSLSTGAIVQLACSWRLPVGRDAIIEASFHGTRGGACLRNVGGSFFDFVAERFTGTRRDVLVEPPDDWGGRAAVEWAEQLRRGPRFDPAIEPLVDVAEVLDRIAGA